MCSLIFPYHNFSFPKLRDPLCVRTDLHVPRRTISRSTQHVTTRARWEKRGHLWIKTPREDPFSNHSFCSTPSPPFTSLSFQTQVMYKWIEPKICLEGVTGAEPLPPSGDREPCPPCNPGFYNNDTATCSPCPPGTYSDGMKRTENSDLYCIPYSYFSVFALCGFLNVFFIVLSPQHVSNVRQALSPPWVTSTNGGMFFLQTWRPPVSMWATPNVTVWMVGIFISFIASQKISIFPKM